MATDDALLATLRELEPSAGTAWVRFRDGDAYAVRVISTMHAEAGGNIVAEVLPSTPRGGPIPAGSFVDFQLADVAEVVVGGVSVFAHAPDAEPGAAADRGGTIAFPES